MLWLLEHIVIPGLIAFGFLDYSMRRAKQANHCNNFKKGINEIKKILVLSTPDSFDANKEAKIVLAIENLLDKLDSKNKDWGDRVRNKLSFIKTSLPNLSKEIDNDTYQNTSQSMIEKLTTLHDDVKRKYFKI